MKQILLLLALLWPFGPLTAADNAHDLADARKRYDEAMAAALRPVREHYLQELLTIKSRAQALNDAALTTAVDREIKALGTSDDRIGDKADFKTQILNTTWTWVHNWEHMTFHEKGVASIATDASYKWHVTNPAERIIEGTFGHQRTFKFTFSPDLNTAKGALDGSTALDSAPVATP
jgi:hypothetical protein